MTDSSIQIGPITLQDFEVPEFVRFGGRHRLAIHRLAGGRKVVERLGPDDGEVSFHGTFSGPDAESRVRALDGLRLTGEIVWLTWESFRRRVVVKSLVAEYRSPWWIPYRVDCVVMHQAGVTNPRASAAASIAADLVSAVTAAAGLPIPLMPLQTALAAPNALTLGTSDYTQALSANQAAAEAIDNQIAMQSATVGAPIGSTSDPGTTSTAFTSTVASAGQLAAAVNTRSYVGRIGAMLDGSGV